MTDPLPKRGYFCMECGAPRAEDTTYCTVCGRAFDRLGGTVRQAPALVPATTRMPAPAYVPTSAPSPGRRRPGWPLVVVIAAVAIVGGAAGAGAMLLVAAKSENGRPAASAPAQAAPTGNTDPAATAGTEPARPAPLDPSAGAAQQESSQVSQQESAPPSVPLPAATAATVPTAPTTPGAPGRDCALYARYGNARFGFSFRYPACFTAGAEPANGDGLEFASPDGDVVVTVWGSNGYAGTRNEVRNREVAQKQSEGATVTYENRGSSNVVLSGYLSSGDIYYEAIWVGPGSVAAMYWTYPASRKAEASVWVTEGYRSFVPGDLSHAH